MAPVPPETRAEVARQRLAELRANFDASVVDLAEPEPGRRRRESSRPRPVRPVHLRLLSAFAVAASVLVVWWLLAGQPKQVSVMPTAGVGSPASSAPSMVAGGTEIVVHVTGKVNRPGIVTLKSGARVNDAVAAAGGMRGKVDAAGINLARVLVDGEQVIVGESPGAGAAIPGAEVKINLNSADVTALETLPGVGPVTAEAIISWRTANGPFRSAEDLLEVKGIGPATLKQLRERVSV